MELNEEEKKAIKELNHYINITEFWKQKEYTNSEIDNYIKIVLNSFDKQQKETEEWRNGIRMNDKVSIPKDKIRAKIQLYKDKKADSIGMLINYEYWKTKIEVLQELLEEK